MKDKLKGGLADNKKKSSFNAKQIKMGVKEEMKEHTKDKKIATEIASDHLTEDAKYYTHLKDKMEKGEVKADAVKCKDCNKPMMRSEAYPIGNLVGKGPNKKQLSPKDFLCDGCMEKEMKKGEMKSADGAVTRFPGKEPLEKEPTMLKKKWNDLKEQLLKVAQVSNKSILSMDALSGAKDQEQDQGQAQAPEQDQDQMQDQMQEQDQDPGQDQEQDQEQDQDPGQDQEDQRPNPEPEQASLPDQNAEQNAPNEGEQESISDDEMADALRQEGYSDQEIGFILWGHHIPTASLEMQQDHHQDQSELMSDPENDMDNRQDVKGHLKNLREVELSHAKAKDPTPDLEMKRGHQQRMLDLEHAKAKAMMEMELEHKKHELAAKRMQMMQEMKEKPTQVQSKKGSDKK